MSRLVKLQACKKVCKRPWTASGAANGDVFAAYREQVLGHALVSDDVVVRDNQPAHKVADLTKIVEVCGARLLYLLPSSPGFNSIKRAFSKLKTGLRTARARTREALEAVSQDAAHWITEHDAKIGLTITDITNTDLKTVRNGSCTNPAADEGASPCVESAAVDSPNPHNGGDNLLQ